MTQRQATLRGSDEAALLAASPLLRQGTEVSEFEPKVDMKQLLESTAWQIGGPYGGFIEGCWNSEDAGATHIFITIAGRGEDYTFTLLDNGRGMGEIGRKSFMNVAMSSRRGDNRARGRHGLGVKRMLSDFNYCEVVDISAAEDDGLMRLWCFSTDEYLRRLAGDRTVHLSMRTLPRDPVAIGLPADATGVRIRLWGARGRHHSPEAVRKNLPRYLPPWVNDKISVDNQALEKREIVGEVLSFDIENDPVLGRIHTQIYVPRDRTDTDVLQIGAMEPLCTFLEFWRELPPRLQKECPSILFNPQVCGVIYVAGFKDYRSGSSKSFDPALFETERVEAFVRFLEFQVAPQIEERLGLVNDDNESEQNKRLLKDLTTLCGGLGGKKVVTPPPAKRLELTVKSVELLPGEAVTIRVRRHADTITEVKWNDTKSGGKVRLRDQGMEATFTAGRTPGVYTLVATAAGEPNTSVEVGVTIVSQRVLRVSPARVTVEPKESITLKAVNVDDATSGPKNLRWETNDPGGKFQPGRGQEVTYQAGRSEGAFDVTVHDDKSWSDELEDWRVKAGCRVDVMQGGERPINKGDGPGDVEIEGLAYRIKTVRAPDHPDLSWIAARGRAIEIQLNTGHSIYRNQKGGHFAKLAVVFDEVLLYHVQLAHGDENLSLGEAQRLMRRLHRQAFEKTQMPEE